MDLAGKLPTTRRQWLFWASLAVIFVLLLALGDFSIARTLVAVLAIGLILKIGFTVIGSFARPVPQPPPPGELRRVKILYRCSLCGTEVRMTTANDQIPEPPRHCQEDMDLMAPIEE